MTVRASDQPLAASAGEPARQGPPTPGGLSGPVEEPRVRDAELLRVEVAGVARPRSLTRLLAALLVALSVSTVLWHTKIRAHDSANVSSRYATVEALVDYGTFAIDQSIYVDTIDKVRIGDHFYSSKPPLLPVVTAGIYWLYERTTGQTLRAFEYNVVPFCNIVMVLLPHLLLLVFYARFTSRLALGPIPALASLAALSLASLSTGYATQLQNHTVAACVALLALYFAYRAHNDTAPSRRSWLVAGALAGILPALDLPSALISLALGVYLLRVDARRALRLFAPAALPGLVVHLALTWTSTGSLVPVYLRPELYRYPGSYWLSPQGIDALHESKLVYAFNMLVGHHGLLSMTPVFLFALVALVRCTRRTSSLRAEAWLVLFVVLTQVVAYLVLSDNYGGLCVGFRFFIVFMPMLFLFFGVWLHQSAPTRWRLPLVALAVFVSHLNALDALQQPWRTSVWQMIVERDSPF